MRTLLLATAARELREQLVWLPKTVLVRRVDTLEQALPYVVVHGPTRYLLAAAPDTVARWQPIDIGPTPELVLYPRGQAAFVPWSTVLWMGADALAMPNQMADLVDRLATPAANAA